MSDDASESVDSILRMRLNIHKIVDYRDYPLWWESIIDSFYLLEIPDLYFTKSKKVNATENEEKTEADFPASTVKWRRRLFPAIRQSLPKDLILSPEVRKLKRDHVEKLIRIVRNKT